MKNYVKTISFVASLFIGSNIYAVCSDFEGSWTGTCKIKTPDTEVEFPSAVSVVYSPDCSRVSLNGFNVANPGIQDVRINKELVTRAYTVNTGLTNEGNVSSSVHWNALDNSFLVASEVSLLAYSDVPDINIRSVQTAPVRIDINENGKLVAVTRTKFFARLNGGDEDKFVTVRRCKYSKD